MDFSLPFHGRWLVANGGVTPETSHSWEIPQQRYAYDFLIAYESGQHFSGDEKDPAAYYCYGREILAPADGFVVALYADAPDSPVSKRRPVCAADDLRGNFVLLNHGSGVYSLLCHLKPRQHLCARRPGRRARRAHRPLRQFRQHHRATPAFSAAGWPRFSAPRPACPSPSPTSALHRAPPHTSRPTSNAG